MGKPAEADLLAEFYAEQPTAPMQCRVGQLLLSTTPEIRQSLEAALAAPFEGTHQLKHTAIVSWCRKRNIALGRDSISRHRRHQCRCGVGE